MSGRRRRIVLLNPPAPSLCLRDFYCSESAKGDYLWPPLDLLVLSGRLAERFELDVIDALAEELDEAAVSDRLAAFRPDVVISLVAGFRLDDDLALLRRLRDEHGFRLLVSGDTPYYEPKRFFRHHGWVDGVLLDFMDGEVASWLEDGRPVPCVFTADDRRQVAPKKTAPVSWPTPRHDLFPLESYRLPILAERGKPITSVLTSFGCPYTCSYCAFPAQPYGERPLEEVFEEWRSLEDRDVGGVFLRDLSFGTSRRRMREICHGLIEMENRIPWICEVKAESLEPEILDEMVAAGCVAICFGLESTDEPYLAGLLRRTDVARLRELSLAARERGLRTLAHFVLGFPGRTLGETVVDVARALTLPVDYISWNRWVPRVGSELRREMVADGRLDPDHDDLDVSVGSGAIRALVLLAQVAFYARPARALHLLRLLGPRGLGNQARELWKRTFVPS